MYLQKFVYYQVTTIKQLSALQTIFLLAILSLCTVAHKIILSMEQDKQVILKEAARAVRYSDIRSLIKIFKENPNHHTYLLTQTADDKQSTLLTRAILENNWAAVLFMSAQAKNARISSSVELKDFEQMPNYEEQKITLFKHLDEILKNPTPDTTILETFYRDTETLFEKDTSGFFLYCALSDFADTIINYSRTALHIFLSCTKRLLQNKTVTYQGIYQRIFMLAVQDDKSDVVKVLLSNLFSLTTPLPYQPPTKNKNHCIYSYIAEKYKEWPYYYTTPLGFAVAHNASNIIQVLLDFGADPNSTFVPKGSHAKNYLIGPLQIALDHQHYDLFKILNAAGGFISISQWNSMLAHHDLETIKILHEHGIVPDNPEQFIFSALASIELEREFIKLLTLFTTIDQGVLNEWLRFAIENNRSYRVIACLLNHGALEADKGSDDFWQTNNIKLSSLALAIKRGDPAIIRLLCTRGAAVILQTETDYIQQFFTELFTTYPSSLKAILDSSFNHEHHMQFPHFICAYLSKKEEINFNKNHKLKIMRVPLLYGLYSLSDRSYYGFTPLSLNAHEEQSKRFPLGHLLLHAASEQNKTLEHSVRVIYEKTLPAEKEYENLSSEGIKDILRGILYRLFPSDYDDLSNDIQRYQPLRFLLRQSSFSPDIYDQLSTLFLSLQPNYNLTLYETLQKARKYYEKTRYTIKIEEDFTQELLLLKAIINQDIKQLIDLLETDVDVSTIIGFGGLTPLHYAVLLNNKEITRLLIQAGALVNQGDDLGMTPLAYATLLGNNNLIPLLLVHKTVVTVVDLNGYSPLHHAAVAGRDTILQMLLDAQHNQADNWANKPDKRGMTPLHYAIGMGNISTVKILLNHNADVNLQDELGRTPLILAAQSKASVAIIEALLDHRPNSRIHDRYGCTAQQYAAASLFSHGQGALQLLLTYTRNQQNNRLPSTISPDSTRVTIADTKSR